MKSTTARWAIAGFLLATASRATAQVPDSARADSARADTTDVSALFLKTYEENRARVLTVPRLGAPELLPTLNRLVFDRDTIEWHTSETISDLLTKVPGVYLWRGGWIGRPEPINFQARGAGSVEFTLDGFPYLAMGPDSLAVDPSILPLSFFDRVEVERLPGSLRVHLFTRRHDRQPPRTRVSVASGDFDVARYQGSLERRLKGGVGFAIAADHLAVPLNRDHPGGYHNTQGWLQASYIPSSRFAATVQLLRNAPKRDDIYTLGSPRDTLSLGLKGHRTDLQGMLNLGSRPGSEGFRTALLIGWSGWGEDSTALSLGNIPPHRHVRDLDQSMWQIGGLTALRSRTSSFEGHAWYRSRWTPVEVRASAGTAPPGPLSASVEGLYQRHDGGRSSRWITVRAGLRLPLRFRLGAMIRTGQGVDFPMLATDTVRRGTDWAGLAAFDHPRLAVEVGYWRTDGYAPQTFSLYRTIASIGSVAPTTWLTVSGRIAPRQWFVIDGWYSDARGTGPEGVPPTHSIVNATILSKFLPTFRSGIFGLKLQGTMEAWSTGTIGRDRSGAPIILSGATFFRGQIQLKIGDFIAYYDRVNMQATRLGYVPGLNLLPLASTFGVRWEFTN